MKDKERFYLITKIFLDINGASTSKEISEYIRRCPVKLQKDFTSVRVGSLLRGQDWVEKEVDEVKRIKKYKVKT